MSNIAFAFLLPFIAGLFTGVGGLIAIFKKIQIKTFWQYASVFRQAL